MKKEFLNLLMREIRVVAQRMSNPDRAGNKNREVFTLHEIRPLSDQVAAVMFKKQPGGKIGMAVFYWRKYGDASRWVHFFPTDSHVLGFHNMKDVLLEVERHNLPLNFEESHATQQQQSDATARTEEPEPAGGVGPSHGEAE